MMSEINYTLEYNAATHMAVIICMKFSLDVMDMINIHTANLRPTKSLGVRETESMAVGD